MESRAPGESADDRQIVARVQAGERDAFGALVARYQRMVFALARRMTGSPDEAEDVMQTCFMNAFRQIGEFRGDASFKTWLYGIALNECRMAHRRSGRTVALDSVAEPVAANGERQTIDRLLLDKLVARLPEKQRAALVLRVTEDLSFREIGALIGSSEASAKVSYFHAVKKLRGWVAPMDPTAPTTEEGDES